MTDLTFSQTLSLVENTLFDMHHGTLDEIARRCNCGPAYHIEKFLQVLLIFDKADIRTEDGKTIYRIEEHSYDPNKDKEEE